MTRTQRIVRVGIWVPLPFMLLGSLDLAATLWFLFAQNRDVLHVESPDGRYAATVDLSQTTCGFGQSATGTAV